MQLVHVSLSLLPALFGVRVADAHRKVRAVITAGIKPRGEDSGGVLLSEGLSGGSRQNMEAYRNRNKSKYGLREKIHSITLCPSVEIEVEREIPGQCSLKEFYI